MDALGKERSATSGVQFVIPEVLLDISCYSRGVVKVEAIGESDLVWSADVMSVKKLSLKSLHCLSQKQI